MEENSCPRFFDELNTFAIVPLSLCFNLIFEDGMIDPSRRFTWKLYKYGELKPIIQVKKRSEDGHIFIDLLPHNTEFLSGKYIQVIEDTSGIINIYPKIPYEPDKHWSKNLLDKITKVVYDDGKVEI